MYVLANFLVSGEIQALWAYKFPSILLNFMVLTIYKPRLFFYGVSFNFSSEGSE